MSGPRPIHSKPREINKTPSPNEPSRSYEDYAPYLNDAFMSAAEQFHAKRGEYYSYTPHSSNQCAAAVAAAVGRAGKAPSKPRSSSMVGPTRPSVEPPPSPSPHSKLLETSKPQSVRTPDATSPSDQRKFRSSQSFSEIVMLEDSGLHERLPRSPKSYPSFAPPLYGMGERVESLASTISSITEDNIRGGGAAFEGPIDATCGSALRLPQTPDFTWKSTSETSHQSSVDNPDHPSNTARAQPNFVRKESSTSLGRKDAKREAKKRAKARMYRHGALEGSLEFGHDSISVTIDDSSVGIISTGTSLGELSENSFSTLQGKRLDAVKEKIFHVINSPNEKKKLALRDLNLTSSELPVDAICCYPLSSDLVKLCLAGNQLNYLPEQLVVELAGLRSLDLQQCGLLSLPERWDLPSLRRLDLGHNRLKSFLSEGAMKGMPHLEYLDMKNNEICEWTLPAGDHLRMLKHLSLEYNEIYELPVEIDSLRALKFLNVSNNQITHVPEKVCAMQLVDLLVTPNPLIQPPSEECEQGLDGMRRYYTGLAKQQNFKATAARRRLKRKSKKSKEPSKAPPLDSKDETVRIQEASDEGFGDIFIMENSAASSVSPKAASMETIAQSFASHESMKSSVFDSKEHEEVNDTLKIIVVGMGSTGKTTLIRRLKGGPTVEIPKQEERTIGVDINEWDPRADCESCGCYDTKVAQEGECSEETTAHIKFSVWDFAGQDVYHATHEIFFSQNALYVLLWDMAAHNESVIRRPQVADIDDGWDDSSDEDYDEIYSEREMLRAERALDDDIDNKVQYWVNCIQSRVPGAVILPVASFDDLFDDMENGGPGEAQRRVDRMKERLNHHERRHVDGLSERLQTLKSSHRANSQEATKIRELLSPFHRPKLILGDRSDADVVPRVSGKDSRGFDQLRAKIINIATGRDFPLGIKYPLFRGFVGSPIPPIRIRIREFVRQLKAEKKLLLELRYFIDMLNDYLGFEADYGQIGDALRFLSRIGELSFFGEPQMSREKDVHDLSDDKEGVGPVQVGSQKGAEHSEDYGLSSLGQFVFLDPKWLAATLGCILRHDLKQQIEQTRYEIARDIPPSPRWQAVGRGESFHDANKNCPVITAAEACMLWKARKKIRKAAERSTLGDNSSNACPFIFMQGLLVHFSVFVPIDLSIDKAFLGGEDFSVPTRTKTSEHEVQRFFFLPSQLSRWDPEDKIWTYKSNDSWKTCLCRTWLFPDGSPPGLFEHVIASILRDLYSITSGDEGKTTLMTGSIPDTNEQIGKLQFREILCWKTALNVVLGKSFVAEDGELRESRVDIWVHLVDQESQYCVAGESTTVGMRRLVVSGKGLEGNGCRKIWDGGYGLVLNGIERVISEYRGLEVVKQGVCPQCLATRDLRLAKIWDWTRVEDAIERGPGTITCEKGHRVDVRHVGGKVRVPCTISEDPDSVLDSKTRVPFSDLSGGVVLVGLWDGDEKRVVAAGSGFVVDHKRGYIVTASHILIDMTEGDNFGTDYFGLRRGRAVIGVCRTATRKGTGPQAFFRYFAEIVAKNPRNMDAAVLRINAKIRADVGGDGSDCGKHLSDPLTRRDDLINERLQRLRPTKRCEYEEEVRILGYNQGGEGLVVSPRLNRVIEVVKGNVVKIHDARDLYHNRQTNQKCFRPFMEIVVGNCPTIGGQSGGPCVNQAGKVIGILSRADPEDKSRCYLVPAKEFMELVNVARSWENYQNFGAS